MRETSFVMVLLLLIPSTGSALLRESDHNQDIINKENIRILGQDEIDAYYSGIDISSPGELRCSLHKKIRGHRVYPYSGVSPNTWDLLELADEDPNNPQRVLDVYKNRSYGKLTDREGQGQPITYNREHTWPKTYGFSSAYGNLGLPNAPHTDSHMLYLSDTRWNADRGNKPYGICDSGCSERVTEFNNGSGGGSGVYPGQSNWLRGPEGNNGTFEVWSKRQGDMARAVMYMAIRYEGGQDINTGQDEPDLQLTDDRSKIVATSKSPAYMGLLSTLIQWHREDPPDAGERRRNDVIQSFQGNRNPFIDQPDWATAELFNAVLPADCIANPQ